MVLAELRESEEYRSKLIVRIAWPIIYIQAKAPYYGDELLIRYLMTVTHYR
jgi:hypothetical protein